MTVTAYVKGACVTPLTTALLTVTVSGSSADGFDHVPLSTRFFGTQEIAGSPNWLCGCTPLLQSVLRFVGLGSKHFTLTGIAEPRSVIVTVAWLKSVLGRLNDHRSGTTW